VGGGLGYGDGRGYRTWEWELKLGGLEVEEVGVGV